MEGTNLYETKYIYCSYSSACSLNMCAQRISPEKRNF